MPTHDHIAVPAEYGIRAHHQVQSLEHVPRDLVQQCRQQRPITRGEPDPVRTELPLQDRELMAQREDLRVFVPAAHRQQPQQREDVRHTEVGQSQEHGRSPCHSVPLSHERPTGRHRTASATSATSAHRLPPAWMRFSAGATLQRPGAPRITRALALLLDEINATPPAIPGDTRPITYQLAPQARI